MSDELRAPSSGRRLLIQTLAALAVASLVTVLFVLPAEYGRDPTGLGRITGLSRLWAPPQVNLAPTAAAAQPLAREYAGGFRTDTIEIPLGFIGGGKGPYELEYKVHMKKGASLVYEWEAIGADTAEDIYYDFHGHTLASKPGETMVVSTHKQAQGPRQAGALVAPFDGIQGWFFQNSAAQPVVIRVRVSGFYDLIPPGQTGNEAGIKANTPAVVAQDKR
jgi:hypothetical protein